MATNVIAVREEETGPQRNWRSRFATIVSRNPIPWIIGAAILARLPFIAHPLLSDESGFMLIGSQWKSGLGSMYGAYWVDRPPLLIGLFSLADLLGGTIALRLIGCVAVGITIYAVSVAARSAVGAQTPAGRKAGIWGALVAGALLAQPLMGISEVNGELLAAPFISSAIACLLVAVSSSVSRLRLVGLSIAAGALGLMAVLIKQNMLDVFVFTAVLLIALRWQRRISTRRLLSLSIAGIIGLLFTASATALVMLAKGPTFAQLYYAMYPFRMEAAQAIADDGGAQFAGDRLQLMLGAALLAGFIPLIVAVLAAVLKHRRFEAPVLAALALLAYAGFSIVMGGAYWTHYLIQGIIPVALLVGLLLAGGVEWLRFPALYAVAAALLVLPLSIPHVTTPNESHVTGRAIQQVAHRGDTIVTVYGHPEVTQSSGLSSPYQHLWSLPVHVLDPKLTELTTIMQGPRAPTWFVAYESTHNWGIDSTRLDALLQERYHLVNNICGLQIYLRDGAIRNDPVGSCD